MNKLIIILLFLLGGVATTQQTTSTVYICTGPKSACYHTTPNCSGLNRCSASIQSISLDEARKLGRRPCSKCCK